MMVRKSDHDGNAIWKGGDSPRIFVAHAFMPKHEFPYKANVQIENSYGFGVLTNGIDLARYTKNPVVLKNHNIDEPVGTSKDLKSSANGDIEVIVIVDDTDDEEFQKLVRDINKNLYQGISLGLDPDWTSVKFGVEGFPPELPVLTKCELAEITITPLPSNEDCLRLMHNGKYLAKEEVKVKLSLANTENQSTKISNAMNKLLLFMISALKLDSATTEDQALAHLQKIVNDNAEVEKLKKEKEDAVAESDTLKLSRVTDMVESAIASNKITAAQKDDYIKLAKSDFNSAKNVLDALKPHTTISDKLNLSGGGSGSAADGRENWSWDDFHKKDSKALLAMKTEDKQRYIKLFNAKFGSNPNL